LRLHDNLPSGNGYKVRLLLAQLDIPFERIEYDITTGETRPPEFLEKVNANGRVPALETGEGEFLPESNAILFYLADGTPLLPDDRLGKARCSGCSSIETSRFHRTIGLRFWSLLTEEGTERFELAST